MLFFNKMCVVLVVLVNKRDFENNYPQLERITFALEEKRGFASVLY